MKIRLYKFFIAAAVLLLAVTAAACSMSEIDLPPLPAALPEGTAADLATPGPEVPSTPEPPVPLPPTPEPAPASTPEPAPDPLSLIPPPLPLDAPEKAPGPVKGAPVITIRDETLPEDMAACNVQELLGWIEVDRGQITKVAGTLTNSDGKTVQQTIYCPYSYQFSLAGTVNADLSFAVLSPDTYTYSVVVTAEDEVQVEEIIIDRTFRVYPQGTVLPGSSDSVYSARLTDDTGTEGVIWNFFIKEFQNPYAAAAILSNIYAESGCSPVRLQGEIDDECVYSNQYTVQVDNGAIDRAGFVSGYCAEGFGPGYGLCQWSGERRGILYDMAQARGTSVGDTETQCFVIMYELTYFYPDLLESLRNAGDVYSATMDFCNVYEQPAYRAGRTAFAQKYLDAYAA